MHSLIPDMKLTIPRRRGVRSIAAKGIRYHVLSVDYRLAPKYPYPSAQEDVRGVLRWVNSGELGFQPDRITLGGVSSYDLFLSS
jgi:acetyl esterase/lipase